MCQNRLSIFLVYKSQTDTLPLMHNILCTYNRCYSIFNLYRTALLFGMTKYNTVQKVISKNYNNCFANCFLTNGNPILYYIHKTILDFSEMKKNSRLTDPIWVENKRYYPRVSTFYKYNFYSKRPSSCLVCRGRTNNNIHFYISEMNLYILT